MKNADYTMEKIIETITLLRQKYHFKGYIHAKSIPGASDYLIKKLGGLVDRMSINIELPTQSSLKLLAPDKDNQNISHAMALVKENKSKVFVPAGQSTQLIIGASPETDFNILGESENLYQKYHLKRVFYSAYVPLIKINCFQILLCHL